MTESLRGQAATALRGAFTRTSATALNPQGYVPRIEDNLLPGIGLGLFEADFDGAGGSELMAREAGGLPKFCAVHSSAALAVNSYALWKRHAKELSMFGAGGFESLRFEARCKNGIGTPPTMDVLLAGHHHVVGIESKCLEYFADHTAVFADAYDLVGDQANKDARRSSPWFRELHSLRAEPQKYVRLDAAQLIKHYMGLAHTFPAAGAPCAITLGYVFWEPENWTEVGPCVQHREELEQFAAAVAGDRVAFRWISYLELWAGWSRLRKPAWLGEHVAALRKRYSARIPA